MQLIIQKKYLVLVEVTENIFAVFLVVVNFIFTIVQEVKETVENVVTFVSHYFKLKTTQTNLKSVNNFDTLFSKYKNNFILYSNLLAPPQFV
jgi:hypothetical protein